MKQFTPTIISFLLIALLGFYIANFREGNYLPVWIFWFCTITIFSLIVYQISKIKIKNQYSDYHIHILLQILMTAFLMRMLFISTGNALAGYDAYNEFVTLSKVNNMGYWNPNEIGGYGAAYPILYMFGIIWSQIIDVNMFTTAKWMPISFFFVAPLFIYLIGNLKYSKRAALLASFGFAFLYISLFFHTTLQRETVAFPIFLLTIYLYYRGTIQKENGISYISLAILTAIVCVLSHHLTSFLLLIFFITYTIIDKFAPSEELTLKKEHTSIVFTVLLFALTFGYWVYLKYTPIEFLTLVIKESTITMPEGGAIIPTTLRYKILYYGEIIFAILFALLSTWALVLRNKERVSSDIALFIYSGITGLIMVLTLQGRILPHEGMGLGSRFQSFVYIGIFILSGYTVSEFLRKYNRQLKRLILIIFVAYALLSIYRIPPYLYSEKNEFVHGEARPLITEEEVSAVTWVRAGNAVADISLRGAFQLNELPESKYTTEYSDIVYLIHSHIVPFSTNKYITNSSLRIYDNGLVEIYYCNLL